MSLLFTKRALFTGAATTSAAGAFYYTHTSTASPAKKKMLPAYEATFSVPLQCDDCVKDISSALEKLPGELPHPERQRRTLFPPSPKSSMNLTSI